MYTLPKLLIIRIFQCIGCWLSYWAADPAIFVFSSVKKKAKNPKKTHKQKTKPHLHSPHRNDVKWSSLSWKVFWKKSITKNNYVFKLDKTKIMWTFWNYGSNFKHSLKILKKIVRHFGPKSFMFRKPLVSKMDTNLHFFILFIDIINAFFPKDIAHSYSLQLQVWQWQKKIVNIWMCWLGEGWTMQAYFNISRCRIPMGREFSDVEPTQQIKQ